METAPFCTVCGSLRLEAGGTGERAAEVETRGSGSRGVLADEGGQPRGGTPRRTISGCGLPLPIGGPQTAGGGSVLPGGAAWLPDRGEEVVGQGAVGDLAGRAGHTDSVPG